MLIWRFSLLTLLSGLLCSQVSFAQWQKVTYNELNGLQNSLVKGVSSDSLGFMWLATDDGLIRFDGTNFTQFKEELPSKYVKSVFTTSTGKTLATTDLGLVRVNTFPNHPTLDIIIKGDNYASDTLMWYPKSIFECSDKKVWVSDNHAIYKFDSDLKLLNRYQFSERDLPTNFQRSFAILEDPVLGIYTFSEAGYLYKYNSYKDSFEEVPLLTTNERINHAFFFKGKIIVATQSGVAEIILNKNGKEILSKKLILPISASHITKYQDDEWIAGTWTDGVYKVKVLKSGYQMEKMDFIKQKVISSVFVDNSQNIWLASDNGALYLKEQYFSSPYKKYTNGYIQSIIEDEDKVIFTDGNTVYFCDSQSNHLLDRWKIPSEFGIVLRMIRIEDEYWFTTNLGDFLVYSIEGDFLRRIECSEYGGAIYDVVYSPKFGLWYLQDHSGLYNLHRMKYPSTYDRSKGVEGKINTIKILDGQLYLGGSSDEAYFYKFNTKFQKFENLSKPVAITRNVAIGINDFLKAGDDFYLATNFGLAKFSEDSLIDCKIPNLKLGAVKGVVQDHRNNNVFWLTNSNGLVRIEDWKDYLVFDEISGLPTKTMTYRGILLSENDEIWVGTAAGIGVSKKLVSIQATPTPIFTSIKNSNFDFNPKDKPEIAKSSYIEFQFASLSYPGNLIQYKFRYNQGEWKNLGWANKFIVSGLETGKYTLELMAKQTGEYHWSEPARFYFVVSERWYRTWYGILGAFSVLFGGIFIVFKLYDEKNQHDKEILEKLVSERTEEVKQKNKILSNRELILKKQVSKFMNLNSVLEKKQKEVEEQLLYANSLQSVVLPSLEKMNKHIQDSFVLFIPKETVSGDFYWEKTFEDENEVVSYYVVGDSIGHGIPGVIQSIIGLDLLNQVVNDRKVKTNDILEQLDIKLCQIAEKDPTMIGMDLVVLRVVKIGKEMNVEFSGAKRPLFYIEDNQLFEVKGTRRAIGDEPTHVKAKGFQVHTMKFKPNTLLYLTSNGYYDQFNSKEKRIGISKFRDLLRGLSDIESLSEQKEWLNDYYLRWRGKAEQIDDITILGLRL
ncbi:SpoIIE family protein phosphatase [Flammeovirga sp. EKP202]|uniref:SpoIIE family protein phosphatase n=1 Tax=Flammeovirga sp. EKP202 TaxID=2770592 RepID=UPI00165F8F6F|nr:SpoIIE family protein phosphatase [Flammeovirga sp. EKP202]MBD0402510.1 SpoIIE family protein phosphatase [Flammeovirga sp. EKP202]